MHLLWVEGARSRLGPQKPPRATQLRFSKHFWSILNDFMHLLWVERATENNKPHILVTPELAKISKMLMAGQGTASLCRLLLIDLHLFFHA